MRLLFHIVALALFGAGMTSSLFAQAGELQFSQPLYTITESSTNGTLLTPSMTVTRTGGSSGALTVSYCVWASEVANNAVEDTNYLLLGNTRRWVAAGTLTWADGDSADKSFTFIYADPFGQFLKTIRSSNTIQGTITYSARLTNVIGGASLGPNAISALEVLDAQAPEEGVINLSARRFYGANGGSGAVISVRRDGGTTGSISVNYATSSSLPPVSSNGISIPAGIAGVNYTTTTGTLTWDDGDSALKTFIVPLPAAANSSGTMNVAINLSSPTNGAMLGTVPSALLTIQNKASLVYNINDATDFSTYRVSLPSGPAPVRGILFWFPGTAGDDRHFTIDPNFRKSADLWRFAIVSPKGNTSISPTNFAFPQPMLAFLFDRLHQIAETTGRPEIFNAPFVFSGMSAGGYGSSKGIGVWPERTIGIIAQQGWTALPIDLLNTPLNESISEIPSINVGGQNDGTQAPPSNIFPALNGYRKNGLTRSANVICWGRPHTFSNTSDKYNSFPLYWLDQIMAAGRYLPSQAPTATTAPILGSLPISSGWWGARNCTNTVNYELAGGSSRYLNIGPDATFSGIKDVSNPLLDSWFPTESAARAFRAHSSLPTITFSTPAQFASGLVNQSVNLAINTGDYGSGIVKIEFYDGSTLIGEDSTSPYHLAWAPTSRGMHSLTAIASTTSGPASTAFTLLLVGDPVTPTIFSSQATNGVIDIPLSYQITASGPPTTYTLASGSLPPGITLASTTGILSGTPTATGTYTPSFTATNSAGTSSAVIVTLRIASSVGNIIHESFTYPVGTNNPDPDSSLNGGNGLPATNLGGNPTGTSTGIKGNWGTTTDVVAGLSYTQGAKIFTTSGNAGRVINDTWGGNPYFYQLMTLDPFVTQRISGGNTGNFGLDGSSLFLSLLGQTSSATADSFRFSLRYDGTNNFYISNTTSGWSLNGTPAMGAPLALNTPTLFVVRLDFAAGASDTISLWINPPLGSALGTPNASVSGLNFPGIGNFQTRAAVANAMIFDEIRLSTSLAAVTPYTQPIALQTFRSTYSLAANGSQDLLTPAGDEVENLLKFAFNMMGNGVGQQPTLLSPNTQILTPDGTAGLPRLDIIAEKVAITYIRRKTSSNPGVSYIVEFSDALDSWAVNPAASEAITPIDDTFERVTVTDSITTPTTRFGRVKIRNP